MNRMRKMRRVVVVLAVFLASVFFATPAVATDSSATATVVWKTPFTITEINGYKIKMYRKVGTSSSTSMSNVAMMSSSAWGAYFSKLDVTPGCFKITGDPSSQVTMKLDSPTSVGTSTITATTSTWALAGVIGAACVTDPSTATSTIFNGTTPSTIPANGEFFATWGYSGGNFDLPKFTLTSPNIANRVESGVVVLTINYV